MDYRAVELDAGEQIPSLNDYDALWVMGGPMDVWQREQYPWLNNEIETIREAVVTREMPFLGLCLGHQLLAAALDGEVGKSTTPEIGILDVNQTEAGRRSPFLAHLPETIRGLQWHSAEVTKTPAVAERLMESEACHCQAMSYGRHALSLQFHVEIENDTVGNWGAIPAYADALEASLGVGAVVQFDRAASEAMGEMNRVARQFFDNWVAVTQSPAD